MTSVRVRFAPSPTGYLHIGGARTALFNFLFARAQQGKFFLRIEDTDRARSTDTAVDAILDGLSWLGLHWDEWEGSKGRATRQTDRLDLYRQKVFDLLDRGLAYRCYCTAETLSARRKEAMAQGKDPRYDGRCRGRSGPTPDQPSAIRFAAASDGEIVVDDLVKGKVTFDARVMDDLILLRSDGIPTYNLCVVVDDIDMEITHVLRGDDHLNNTPRQIGLYRAFGQKVPQFGHFSMILGADKARLSKRHGAMAVQQYRDDGYLPEAMVNYLVRLGWSFKDEEIFSLDDLIKKFSLEQIGKSAAVFSWEKLTWLNAHHIKTGDSKRIAALLFDVAGPFAATVNRQASQLPAQAYSEAYRFSVVEALKPRSRTLKEMSESAVCFFADEVILDEKAEKVVIGALPILRSVHAALLEVSFDHAALSEAFSAVGASIGQKLSDVAQPIRAAVTGRTVSPGIFDLLEMLGKERTLLRLARQIDRLERITQIA